MFKNAVNIRLWCILSLLIVLVDPVEIQAQQTAVYYHDNSDYREAQELFDKAKYNAAKEKFEAVIARIDNTNDEVQINAEYYRAICALELFHKDAEFLLTEFIKDHPESPRVRIAYFQLGRYYYRKKKYRDALRWFDEVDIYDLGHEELSEFYFKRGYSYFRLEKFDDAAKMFYEIKEVDNEYRDPALYYYSHVAYQNEKYQTALQGFEQLSGHPKFGTVVPYYVAQIYYMQRRFDEVIAYAKPLLDSAKIKRQAEISRVIGEAYYNTDRFAESIPYLERYHARHATDNAEDHYQLGYAYYRGGMYDKAIAQLNLCLEKKDAMAQVAYYHIGDCYLKLENKKAARQAFGEASKLTFDPELKENSLYNYAKLSYELSQNPFNEAIKAFEDYIATYPESGRIEEAYGYLVNVYLTTKNYDKALESLDRIPNKDMRLQTAYQLVAYNSAIGEFNSGNFAGCLKTFDLVSVYPVDRTLAVEAMYWKGEANYRMGKYDEAIDLYEGFRKQPGAILSPFFRVSNYNIGYCYFKKHMYSASLPYFRSFADVARNDDKARASDALLRIGDGYFIARNYVDAVVYYGKAVDMAQKDVDYALYQKAFCQGLAQRPNDKIVTLKKLLLEHPKSVYIADGIFELGETYRLKNEYDNALRYYQKIVDEYPLSNKMKRAQLSIGLIEYKRGKTEKALTIFETIALQSKTYDEAKDALRSYEDICVQHGQIERYNRLLEKLNYVDFSRGKLDTTNFAAAENLYHAEKWTEAIAALDKYLREFKPAIFAVNAYYYKGVAHYNNNQISEAITEFNAVIEAAPNKYYEDALVSHARLNMRQENWQGALGSYISLEKLAENKDYVLEAQVGQMQCFDRLANCTSAIDAAQKVVNNDKAPDDTKVEAEMIMARCYYKMDMFDVALDQCAKVVELTKTEYGAEAQYYIARIYHVRGDYQTSDDEIFKLVKQVPAYDYWIAMGYLLISDNSVALGDLFQAKATLQSIIDHYNGTNRAEVLQKAQQKLDAIVAMENAGSTETRREDIEVELDGYEPGQEKLFEEDEEGGNRRRDRKQNGSGTPVEGANGTSGEGSNPEGGQP